jgi:hypothetical protein
MGDVGLDRQQGGEKALLTHEREYAFGEMDEVGMSNIADRSSCGAALLLRFHARRRASLLQPESVVAASPTTLGTEHGTGRLKQRTPIRRHHDL